MIMTILLGSCSPPAFLALCTRQPWQYLASPDPVLVVSQDAHCGVWFLEEHHILHGDVSVSKAMASISQCSGEQEVLPTPARVDMASNHFLTKKIH